MSLSPFHPEAIARTQAHDCRAPGTCATDAGRNRIERRAQSCTCAPDPADLAAVWAGRARMARARRAAGVPLDALDHQALDRADTAGEAAA